MRPVNIVGNFVIVVWCDVSTRCIKVSVVISSVRLKVLWVRGYYGSHTVKCIERVELCRFWKKGMILLQTYVDSGNWLTTNLIRR